ncbi:uncharacterized protein LOC104900008 isoform X4 [Beta vulgaris subsp. vulgaris]|uniref:uncharacterized protein LOC104900008 isoform X4 n=1 Tax=Beta vulgaris subsp. vulgaris TaxID=3555 RepID=UPI0025498177|nr:uncharacterized protein LOC104900008 isoform X4 [Beta vulgaris subsp. vulgaris]
MERVKHVLDLSEDESESVSRLSVNPHEFQVGPSFYEDFALRGIRVDRVEPGFISCTFKVPPRLTDELEVTSRLLGKIGAVSGTSVIIKKKASEEIVAEGRHSLFSRPKSPRGGGDKNLKIQGVLQLSRATPSLAHCSVLLCFELCPSLALN